MPTRRTKQLLLNLPNGWGGKRKRAGRKPGPRSATPHRARPAHRENHPVHVTMRAAFRPLRHAFVFSTLRACIAAANRKNPLDFRIVHFSVQSDHLHLIVESTDKRTLSSGMRGLAVRIARTVNALVSRSGTFWGDRWHGRALTSPRATRNVLRYVLANFHLASQRPSSRRRGCSASGGGGWVYCRCTIGLSDWRPSCDSKLYASSDHIFWRV
jgi:putative transposase